MKITSKSLSTLKDTIKSTTQSDEKKYEFIFKTKIIENNLIDI